jgi:hypothetical protein
MSSASNFGWNSKPLHNVNSNYVNVGSENTPRFFSSNEISGGAKRLKRKIKNITKRYKMGSKKSTKRMKSRIKARYIGRTRTRSRYGGKKRRITHKNNKKAQRGGNYSQFMNNLPNTSSYSLGSLLSSAASGLASPPPFNQLPNCTNCVDNYNHYTKMGSSSLGH